MHLKELDANLVVVLDALLIDASVTKAAERLGRSPSAVSHALSNLREVFGDELFVRAGQRLVATAKAQRLAPVIHVIVAGMESLLRPSAPFDPATQMRSFALACRETFELTLLQDLRARLKKAAPGIAMEWRPLQSERSHEDLRQGKVHFLVCSDKDEQAADFCWQKLSADRFVTLAGPGHKFLGARPDLAAFAGAGHIRICPEGGSGDPVETLLGENGLARNIAAETSSLFAGIFLALETGALITLPEIVARTIMRQTKLRPIEIPFEAPELPVYLAWHRSHDRDEAHEWVRQQIGEAATAG